MHAHSHTLNSFCPSLIPAVLTSQSSLPEVTRGHMRQQRLHAGDEFETLVKPSSMDGRAMKIPYVSSLIHGIYDKQVQSAPSPAQMGLALACWVYQRCRASGGSTLVLQAHNSE